MKDTADPQIALQIRERFKKYDQAFNKNDATAVAALFAEDALQVTPEGLYSGRHAIEKRYAEQVFPRLNGNNHFIKTDR